MKDELEQIALIEQYLKEELSPSDKRAFENQIEQDPGLAEDVAIQREMYMAIQNVGDAELQNQLDAIHNNFEARRSKGVSRIRKFGYGGGIVVFLILTVVVMYFGDVVPKKAPHSNDHKITHHQLDHTDTIPTPREVATPISSEPTHLLEDTGASNSVKRSINTEENVVIDSHKVLHSFDLPVSIATPQHTPSYYFDGETLWLYGVEFDLRQIEIRKHQTAMYLFNKNKYYLIEKTDSKHPLTQAKNMRALETLSRATGTGPSIKVMKPSIYIHHDPNGLVFHVIEVEDILDERNTQYKFRNGELIITENLFKKLGEHFDIIHLEEYDRYYIKVKKNYYLIEEGAHNFTELTKETNPEIMALFKTNSTQLQLRYLTLEDIYNQYESN